MQLKSFNWHNAANLFNTSTSLADDGACGRLCGLLAYRFGCQTCDREGVGLTLSQVGSLSSGHYG